MLPNRRMLVAMIAVLVVPAFMAGAAGSQQTATAAAFNATGYPLTDSTVTLRVATIKNANHGDFAAMPVVIDYEQRTNVRVEWDQTPAANARERLNLILASGDLPDVFMGMNLTPSDIMQYGPQGTLIPLEGLIDRYGPNIQAVLASRPAVRAALTTPDGNIYTLVKLNESIALDNPDNLYINRTWLDTLGLDVPRTTDEFESVLRAFKTGDPNRNGRTDEIPFSFRYQDAAAANIWSMFGSFGVLANNNQLMVLDDKVIFSATQPGFRDAVAWFSRLYAAGLIDPESFTQSGAQYTAKGRAEHALIGSFVNFFDEAIVGTERAQSDYVALAPLVGPGGDQMWNRYEGSIAVGAFAITSANRHPELSLRWVDGMYDERGSIEFCFGKYGLNVDEDANGRLIFLDDPSGTMNRTEFRYRSTPAASGAWAITADVYDRMEQASDILRKFARFDIYAPYMPEQVFPLVYYTAEQEARLSTMRTDVYSYVRETVARWISGQGNVEAEWSGYVDRLNRMGLNEMISIYQAAYDARR
jgi:putative aldouronate transport system substrate-binding protein